MQAHRFDRITLKSNAKSTGMWYFVRAPQLTDTVERALYYIMTPYHLCHMEDLPLLKSTLVNHVSVLWASLHSETDNVPHWKLINPEGLSCLPPWGPAVQRVWVNGSEQRSWVFVDLRPFLSVMTTFWATMEMKYMESFYCTDFCLHLLKMAFRNSHYWFL